MNPHSIILKLYLPTMKAESLSLLLSLLNITFPPKKAQTSFKQLDYKISNDIIYHPTFRKWKYLLQDSALFKEEYFFQAQNKDYYFDCLTIKPFTVVSFLLPKNRFLKYQSQIDELYQQIFFLTNGYLIFCCSLSQWLTNYYHDSFKFISYADRQCYKYLASHIERKHFYHEMAELFCTQYNSCFPVLQSTCHFS